MAGRVWPFVLLAGHAAAFGGLNYADLVRQRDQQARYDQASVGTRTQNPAEYKNGHFDSEYPSQYIINSQFLENNNVDAGGNPGLPTANNYGRQLSSADGPVDTEGALLEAAKAGESEPAAADIDTPALLTEV